MQYYLSPSGTSYGVTAPNNKASPKAMNEMPLISFPSHCDATRSKEGQ